MKRVAAGERLSYGLRYRCARDSTIATVPLGYADGVPRRLGATGGEVLVGGRRRPIAGTITMDQLLVDCGDDPVQPGDEVVLIGTQGDETITADDWAARLDTIGYEVVCGIGPVCLAATVPSGPDPIRGPAAPPGATDGPTLDASSSPVASPRAWRVGAAGRPPAQAQAARGGPRHRHVRGPVAAACPTPLFDVPDDTVEGTVPTGDGGTLHYLERGSGRPLVLLHGITLRADVWAPQLHQLADRYRVIAVDLRGHGGSVAGSSGYGMGPLGDDVAAVLEGLDLRDAVVVGHSMGGMGLMQFCGAHPDVLGARVAGLVFMATRAHQVVPPHLRRAAVRVAEGRQAVVDAGRPLPRPPGLGPRFVRPAFGDRPSRRALAIVAEMVEAMDDTALLDHGPRPARPRCPHRAAGHRDAVARARRLPRPAHAGRLGPAPRRPAAEHPARPLPSGGPPADAGAPGGGGSRHRRPRRRDRAPRRGGRARRGVTPRRALVCDRGRARGSTS